MKMNLPTPKNWQDFEDLCYDLWRFIWGDPNTSKNGRVGQPQSGVDIYGIPFYQESYNGIQCKGKDVNYGETLTIDEITKEADKALNFKPLISNLIFATTTPADVKLQAYCRQCESKYPFRINIRDWEYISTEIRCRKTLFEKFYGGMSNVMIESTIHISLLDDLYVLFGFLERDAIRTKSSNSVRLLLGKLFFELSDNAFRYGNASNVEISFNNSDLFCFRDDGAQFCILELCKKGHGGSDTFSDLKSRFDESELIITTDYIDDNNVYLFNFLNNSLMKNIIKTKELSISNFKSRQDAVNNAKYELSLLKKYNNNCKLLLCEPLVVSSAVAYCDYFFNNAHDYVLSVCVPDSPINDSIIKLCENFGVKCIVR